MPTSGGCRGEGSGGGGGTGPRRSIYSGNGMCPVEFETVRDMRFCLLALLTESLNIFTAIFSFVEREMFLNGAYVLRFVSFIIILHQRKELKVTTKTEKACKAASINTIVRFFILFERKETVEVETLQGSNTVLFILS